MPFNPMTILAADDDEEDLELIEIAIRNVAPQADVHKVKSGREVLRYLGNLPDQELPCLIILDFNMVELNGAQVLSRINEHNRFDNIPKVILSTSGAPIHIHECKARGATDYLVKPNNMKDLISLAEKMLTYCQSDGAVTGK